MMQIYKDFDKLITTNLPEGSAIIRIAMNERFGSHCVDVHHVVSEEYQKANDLWSRRRILSIRLIKGEHDEGLPISSFADRD